MHRAEFQLSAQEWREVKLGGKDMLKQAQPHFETFKALFTHGVLGISRSGRPIWVMRVGILRLCPSDTLDNCAALMFWHDDIPKSACTAPLARFQKSHMQTIA